MTKTEQKRWIRDRSKRMAQMFCKAIDDGQVPKEWGGMELSELMGQRYLAESFLRNGDGKPLQDRNTMIGEVRRVYINSTM